MVNKLCTSPFFLVFFISFLWFWTQQNFVGILHAPSRFRKISDRGLAISWFSQLGWRDWGVDEWTNVNPRCGWKKRNACGSLFFLFFLEPRLKTSVKKWQMTSFFFPHGLPESLILESYINHSLNKSGLTLPGKLFLAPILLGKSCLIFWG